MDLDCLPKISSVIPAYPSIANPDFEYDLFAKREFQDLKLGRLPERPNGDFLDSQKILARYISPYTAYESVLVAHQQGTGKTRLLAAIVESAKEKTLSLNDGITSTYNRALIITPSKLLADQTLEEIMKTGRYDVELTEKQLRRGVAMDPDAVRARIFKEIRKSYEIVKRNSFINRIPEKDGPKEKPIWDSLIKKYSNRVIVIDEAHQLRKQPPATGKDKPPKKMYERLHRFLHKVKNVKIVLLTGTPIWDKVEEIATLMNLINPLSMQLPTKSAFIKEYFDRETGKLKNTTKLGEYFKGRVSFLRSTLTDVKIEEMGVIKPWFKHLKVYPDVMSDFQAKVAQEVFKPRAIKGELPDTEATAEGTEVASKDPIFNQRDPSLFVFPDGSYGRKGFDRYITFTGTRYKMKPELEKAVTENLYKHSASFASVIEAIKKSPKQKIFVYFGDFKKGSGAILFALILEKLCDYTLANTRSLVSQQRKGTLEKAKRFALFTSDQWSTKPTPAFWEIYNSAEDKFGEYVQVVIGTKLLSTGVNILNTRQFHNMSAYWNLSEGDQAAYRIIRFGGLSALPPSHRSIKIFRHTPVVKGSILKNHTLEQAYPVDKGFAKTDTIGVYIYRMAEEKDLKSAQIRRLIKKYSFDCALTYKRNVDAKGKKGSRECDYEECEYDCNGVPTTFKSGGEYSIPEALIDDYTYDIYYDQAEVREVIEEIVEIFRSYYALHISDIRTLVGMQYSTCMIVKALGNIVSSRVMITDRLGFRVYLNEKGNVYFLDSHISYDPSYLVSTYIEKPLLGRVSSLEYYVSAKILKADTEKVCEFARNPTERRFKDLAYQTKIVLAEQIIKDKYLGELKSARAKRAYDTIFENLIEDRVYDTRDGNLVHVLYSTEYTGSSYNVSARHLVPNGKTRLFNTHLKEWFTIRDRDLELKYISDIRTELGKRKDVCWIDNPYDVCGIVSMQDKKFKVYIKEKPGEPKNKGRVCTTYDLEDLYDIYINKLNTLPKARSDIESWSKEKLAKHFRYLSNDSDKGKYTKDYDLLSLPEQRRLYTLLVMTKNDLCASLKRFFADKEILFET